MFEFRLRYRDIRPSELILKDTFVIASPIRDLSRVGLRQ